MRSDQPEWVPATITKSVPIKERTKNKGEYKVWKPGRISEHSGAGCINLV